MIIKQGSLEQVLAINERISEFERKTSYQEMIERLKGKKHLVLVAKVSGNPVGYQLGYEINKDEYYIWLAGVIPSFRNQGVASALQQQQEIWAKQAGFKGLSVKSMNRYPHMLRLLIANQYQIIGYAKNNDPFDGKILFYKSFV